MVSLGVWLTHLFNWVFLPFRTANPLYPIVLFSVLTAPLMLLAFRYTSNQPAIRRAKHRLAAHILEVRLFQDQFGVVWRAYGHTLRGIFSYFALTLKPLAVMLIPFFILLVQLDMRLGWRPVHPQSDLLLAVKLRDPARLQEVQLAVPEGIEITAPPLHIESEREVDWRLRARTAGEFQVEVAVGTERFAKQLVVSDALAAVSAERAGFASAAYWLNPGEAALPADGAVESILVDYPAREIAVAGWKMHWLIPFFVLALAASYAMKGLFRTEF